MSLILNIDASVETATVSLAENGNVLFTIKNQDQKDHAAFLHNAINDIIKKSSYKLKQLSAIAVINGPGSYTGLRVAMASAKGLCYALNKPFITLDSLSVMANAVIGLQETESDNLLYCPLIDARRMEVYTALFNGQLEALIKPMSLILNENSFKDILEANKVCFFGNGSAKFQAVLSNINASFVNLPDLANSISRLSFEHYSAKKFTDLVDSEPLYVKDFHSSPDFSNKK
ncbi:MAG: tRNA (adenosine(37)-N6)-threonylcarbamoyltransferase complex dimerization subunit type 1 TsaB [Ferruginibacter sp.]